MLRNWRLLFSILPFTLWACSNQGASADATALSSQAERAHRSGQQIYEGFCFACHDYGAAAAPIMNKVDDWIERAQKGRASLVRSVEAGLGAMPKNGSCFDCSVEELNSVVDYMLDNIPNS